MTPATIPDKFIFATSPELHSLWVVLGSQTGAPKSVVVGPVRPQK